MTRGDAITILDCERPYGSCGCGATDEEIEEALNMAIEALEQKPCDKCVYSTSEGCQYDDITETIPPFDDCISRQAVLDAINTDWHEDLSQLEDAIKALPPVEPKPKMGRWVGGDGHYICSCCRYDPEYFLEPLGLDGGSYMAIPMKYCPQCGTKMQEVKDNG